MEKKGLIKKIFFISVALILITLVSFVVIKYQVEGEKDLPIKIEKILITSTIEADTSEQTENIWDMNLSQPNDLFIYLSKKNETEQGILKVKADNFVINKAPQKGKVKILRPTGELKMLYKHSQQDYINGEIEYVGGQIDDLKSLQINNGGGMLGFRIKLEELGKYVSNEDSEIIYDGNLLNKVGVSLEEIKTNISFDLTITTTDNISYKATVNVDLPVGDIIKEGSSNIEIKNFDDLVFKRV